ncbi:hypothetical protein H5410_008148 [Solanum commersonii]|uniref:Pectate lyase n=1 Tax=Solanum commersonii TaxID=4109 RepID=A0A9J6AFQ5_SOLCO|nr:hypothetical protein H5410_008148 [Solanum commersonii]
MASLALVLTLLFLGISTLQAEYYAPSKNYAPSTTRKTMNNRYALADCAVGYGKAAIGGKNGAIYVVTNPSDDPVNPKPGTLRYGAIQSKPLWIIFNKDMVITLKNELMINSYKTIDGRGAEVEIAYGPCITIQHVSHVIIHGISIHDCKPGKKGIVRDSPVHAGHRNGADGDGIDIFQSTHVWIDHCYLARCTDGLIDVIHASTGVTISNNYFTQHDKVMLFGHNDNNIEDKVMKVTVAFNYFGPGLIERMPRVRLGYAHVANNRYEKWLMYAIGGSANPTIFSEGNYFLASKSTQVTKRESKNGWQNWKWRSSKDKFLNGAYFIPSGYGTTNPYYSKAQSFPVADGSMPHKNGLLNVIDSCWRWKGDWSSNRKALADCAIGFGSSTIGGKYGDIYIVTDSSDDPINPKPGTLRYGAIQSEPLWIIFKRDMILTLKNELMVNSYKTIDGRGAKVEISNGPCITLDYVTNVIIHGISIHDCKPGKKGMVRSSPEHVGERLGSDGDAISVFTSSNVWIDHCYLARATDGLLDVIHASTAVTISNNYFTEHDKVMLLGHNDEYTADRNMKVTVVYNHFGRELVQRMPRVRHGYAHVANNYYDQWLMYAIGGSADPTIFSEGNYFIAPDKAYNKEVTKRETEDKGWKSWKWRSSNDMFMNGAYFLPSGYGSIAPKYTRGQSFIVAHGAFTPSLTSNAGPLQCVVNEPC